MTVTSRFVHERPPLAARGIRSPFPNPPPNRAPIARLSWRSPSIKHDWSAENLAHAIGVASLHDAVVFLDTNVFTKELDMAVWDAVSKRRILITPGVWKELAPWLKTPFCNNAIRDRVVAAVQSQVSSARSSEWFPHPQAPLSRDLPKMGVLFLTEDFKIHGFDYYFKLLALRKAWGPMAAAVLTKDLGRPPTNDEFLAEVQGPLGERGFRLAKKGLDAANSANMFTDEQLVVMAILTGIMRGTEVLIITRDGDVLEQYFKALCLMKEHYRAMLVADRYAVNPDAIPFREVPVEEAGGPIGRDGAVISPFSGRSLLQYETTDLEFNPLPRTFHFVNVYCFLLGDGPAQMRVTSANFCAETEMAQMLRVKAMTGGLSTDKLNGRNCTIRTEPLTAENHKVTVWIGKETVIPCGAFGSFGIDDYNNTLFANELFTHLSIRDS
jgi:hypothetical protein